MITTVSKHTDLFEDGDDGQRWRENDECADDGDVELLQRQSDRSDVDFSRVVWVLSFEEHAVGDHGKEEQCHAAGDSLDTRERAASWPREHGHPQVVVGHLLAHRAVEQLLELGQVTTTGSDRRPLELGQVVGAGHWEDPLHHAVILFHGHPTITDEKKPATPH